MSPSPRRTVLDNGQRSRFEDPPGFTLCVRRHHEHLHDAKKQPAAVVATNKAGHSGHTGPVDEPVWPAGQTGIRLAGPRAAPAGAQRRCGRSANGTRLLCTRAAPRRGGTDADGGTPGRDELCSRPLCLLRQCPGAWWTSSPCRPPRARRGKPALACRRVAGRRGGGGDLALAEHATRLRVRGRRGPGRPAWSTARRGPLRQL
jgi:hypothetical protein